MGGGPQRLAAGTGAGPGSVRARRRGSAHLTVLECRAPWRDGPDGEWTRFPIVRFHYVKTRREWSTYWRDRNLKFHRYDPFPQTSALDDLLAAVDADRSGIFWG